MDRPASACADESWGVNGIVFSMPQSITEEQSSSSAGQLNGNLSGMWLILYCERVGISLSDRFRASVPLRV